MSCRVLDFPTPEAAAGVELSELVNAVQLFIENYRLMHAGTLYSLSVEEAARQVRAKLLEL